MGIAMFTFDALLAPFQGLASWFMPAAPARARSGAASHAHPSGLRAAAACANHVRVVAQKVQRPAASKPLRVVRVMEAGRAPAASGRMVISGRMADVCAELDRLAAAEARVH